MKCNRHPFESGVGVCATCLRERLLALNETATAAAAPSSPEDERGKLSSHSPSPPPLSFPRSVSPFVSRPAAAAAAAAGGSGSGISILSILLGRRGHGDRDKKPQRSSSSWLSALLHRRRRKKLSRLSSAALGGDLGMSPESVRYAESPSWSQRPKPSPMRGVTAEHNHHRGGGGGLAGFAMCFSPLVAASPSRRRSRVAEIGFSGEIPPTSPGPRYHRRQASVGGPLMLPDRFRRPSSDLRNLN